jgi:MFS family permease
MRTVLLGIINTFDMTARQAFFLEMVPDMKDLANAIALNSLLVNVTRLMSPLIAGLTIALTGEGVCFLVNGVSFIAVLAALLAMDVTPTAIRATAPLGRGLKEGVTYVRRCGPVRNVLLLLSLVSFVGAPYAVLLPVFARELLHGGAYTLSILTAAVGFGALTGAAYLAHRQAAAGLGNTIVLATAAFGVGLMVFPLSHSLAMSLLILFGMGCAQMVHTASSNTVLQTVVDDDKRGRVMSFYTMSLVGMTPLGSLLAGILADHVGAPTALILGGPFCLLGAGLFAWKLPGLREVFDHAPRRLEASNVGTINSVRLQVPDRESAFAPSARAAERAKPSCAAQVDSRSTNLKQPEDG